MPSGGAIAAIVLAVILVIVIVAAILIYLFVLAPGAATTAKSEQITACKVAIPNTAPTGLALAKPAAGSITVTWTAPATATNVSGYRVFLKDASAVTNADLYAATSATLKSTDVGLVTTATFTGITGADLWYAAVVPLGVCGAYGPVAIDNSGLAAN